MRKLLSIIVLAALSYLGVSLILIAFAFIGGFKFSFLDFVGDNFIHFIVLASLLIILWAIRFMVELIILISQKISFSDSGLRYIVTGVVIILLCLIAAIGNMMEPEGRTFASIASFIAIGIYGGLFIYNVKTKEHKHI